MKLLFLHRDLPPDSYTGVAIQVHRLANALVRLGHEVSVYSHTAAPADALYRVLPIDLRGLRLCLRLLPGLKRLWYPLWYRRLDMAGFDAVHIHGDGGFLAYGPRFVRTFYGTAALEYRHARGLKGRLAQAFSFWLERREARRCVHAVGISPHIAEHLPAVTTVIPCLLPEEPSPLEGGPGGRIRKTPHASLLFLGSRFSRKRGELALEAYLRLREAIPGLRMDYVGPAGEALVLRKRAEYKGIDFHARLGQETLTELFRRSWIYLCLSTYEGFGVGIIEAMAQGCVVVTTAHAGSDFIVRDGVNGLITNVERLDAQIIDVCRPGGPRERISAAAREESLRYAPSAVAGAYLEIYRRAGGASA